MLADFAGGTRGLQYVTDDAWISELGIRYSLGVDGLNLFLIALTAIAWVRLHARGLPAASCDRPRLFFFHLALAETAVLGAFMAQDLALFVVFFDLMLVPFYFLIGGWGAGDRVRATTKFVIYTLVGSLLMLAGGGRARRARPRPRAARSRSRSRSCSSARSARARRSGSSCCSRSAFLVKAPLFPLHGWVPDDLPLDAAAGARAALRRAVEGRRLRLPADRAADPARRRRSTSRTC